MYMGYLTPCTGVVYKVYASVVAQVNPCGTLFASSNINTRTTRMTTTMTTKTTMMMTRRQRRIANTNRIRTSSRTL